MVKRVKKAPVQLERRQSWLERYELGESPPQIAKNDGFDMRTVRKHIEVAKQEREVKDARFMVLRNALERHYADLCGYAEKLSGQASGQTDSWAPHDEHLRIALRQHLPRSPIWGYLSQMQGVQQRITELTQEANKKVGQAVNSDSRLSRMSTAGDMGVIPGIIAVLSFQIEQWSRGVRGLNLEESLISEPAREGFVNLRYGFSQMGAVKEEHVRVIRNVLQDWESRIRQWDECQKLERSFVELRRVEKNLKDELAVITLRRVVPGRCRYCPL